MKFLKIFYLTAFVVMVTLGVNLLINDTKEDAHRLVRLLQGLPSKINLIPFNNWTGSQYKRSSLDRIKAFRDIIIKSRLPSPIRKPRGEDIMAACGQLKSNSVKEKASI